MEQDNNNNSSVRIESNYSITKLFVDKKIKIVVDNKKSFSINVKTIRDFFNDEQWNSVYHLWAMNVLQWRKMFTDPQFDTTFDYIKFLIFSLGQYKQYRNIADSMRKNFNELFYDEVVFDFTTKNINLWRDNSLYLTITSEIWEYVMYLLKLVYGEKVTQPKIFNSPEERAFYLKQQELDNKIQDIRQNQKNDGSKDGLIKAMLAIIYSFPALSLDYLFDQTMAQIHFLQKLAAGEVSYKVNAQAYAAGNIKKGKKLDFFIK